jgi:hypothetical protein
MKKQVKVITFHAKILAMSEDEFGAWFERTGMQGKPSDYFPQKKVKPVKKRRGAG